MTLLASVTPISEVCGGVRQPLKFHYSDVDGESRESRTLSIRRMSDPCRSYNKQRHVHVILGVSAVAEALERVDAIK